MSLLFLTDTRNFTNLTQSDDVLTSSFTDKHVAMVATNEHSLLIMRFIVQKLCVPFVVLIGITGNSLSIIVLTRKCMKSSTTSYLTGLAAFDLLYLVFTLYLSLKHYEYFNYSALYVQLFPFARVFTDMSANVSVILTVTFTVERYIGVCHPMKGRILCTAQRAKFITAIVSTIAILCTTPEFCEMTVTWVIIANQTVPVAVYTSFVDQPSYAVGYYWFLVVMFTLLPLVLLCVFNGILIATVISAAKLRKQMTLLTSVSSTHFIHAACNGISHNSRSVHSQPREQQRITKMLITVVIVFLVCQLPGALLLLYKTYTSQGSAHVSREQQNNLKIAGNITNLLIQINAAINFILYSAMSTKFRRVFYRTICSRTRACPCLQHPRHQSNFSRSDGVQMSYMYGERRGSRMTSCSTYTFKIKLSQRSNLTHSQRSPGVSLQKQLNLRLDGCDVHAVKDNRSSKNPRKLYSHKYNVFVKRTRTDGVRRCGSEIDNFDHTDNSSSSCGVSSCADCDFVPQLHGI